MNGILIPLDLMPGFYEKLRLSNPEKQKTVIIQRSNNGRYILTVLDFSIRKACYVKQPADHSDLCQLIDHLAGDLLPEGNEVFRVDKSEDGPPADDLNTHYYPALSSVDSDLEHITIGEGEGQRSFEVVHWPELPLEQLEEVFGSDQV